MANLSELYKSLMTDLENNIKDKNELEKVKTKISEMMVDFVDSMNSLMDVHERQESFEKKLRKIQRKIQNIEEDIYIEDDENFEDEPHDKMHDNDYEFEIRCPYCNEDFIINEYSRNLSEIECPKCHNIIELDWEDYSECDGCCDHCESQCYDEEDDEKSESKVAEAEEPYIQEESQEKSQQQAQNKNEQENKNNTNSNNNQSNKNEDDM